jgi:hypothetical protein
MPRSTEPTACFEVACEMLRRFEMNPPARRWSERSLRRRAGSRKADSGSRSERHNSCQPSHYWAQFKTTTWVQFKKTSPPGGRCWRPTHCVCSWPWPTPGRRLGSTARRRRCPGGSPRWSSQTGGPCSSGPGHPPPSRGPRSASQFVALGPHVLQLLDQLVFDFVQLCAPRCDPFRDLGLRHGPDGRPHRVGGVEERAKPPPDRPVRRSRPWTSARDLPEYPDRGATPAPPTSTFEDGEP